MDEPNLRNIDSTHQPKKRGRPPKKPEQKSAQKPEQRALPKTEYSVQAPHSSQATGYQAIENPVSGHEEGPDWLVWLLILAAILIIFNQVQIISISAALNALA